MKKTLKKSAIFIVSIAILFTTLVGPLSGLISAYAEKNSDYTNIISGLVPVAFGSSASNGTAVNWNGVWVRNTTVNHSNAVRDTGFDIFNNVQPIARDAWYQYYLNPINDGDLSTSQLMKPEFCYDDVYHDILLVFQTSKSDLKGFSLSTVEDNAVKDIKVYASAEQSDLFNHQIASVKSTNTEISDKLNVTSIKYIAFRFKKANFNLSEIEIYGKASDGSGSPGEGLTNLLSTKTPIVYTAVNTGETAFNWTPVRYVQNSEEYKAFGYDYLNNIATEGKDFWNPILSKLTDGNAKTGLFIQPERHWFKDDVLAVYEIDQADIKRIALTTNNEGLGKTIKVYASNSYTDLFSNKIAEFTSTDAVVTYDLDTTDSRFIACIFVAPGFQANELAIYGKTKGGSSGGTVGSDSPNVLKNMLPFAYIPANSGEKYHNWAQIRYGGEAEKNFGYDFNEISSNYDWWKPHLEKITDENDDTGLFIYPERHWVKDDILIIYKIPDTMIDGFTLKFKGDGFKKVQIYASTVRGSLFLESNKIANLSTFGESMSNVEKINKRAKWVAIVLTFPEFTISDIAINGNDYVRPNYGTNLIAGKDPMALFTSKREYPIGSTGERFMADDPTGVGGKTMDAVIASMYMLTDNDFSTYKDWFHDNAQRYPTSTSRYKVIAYDLGSVAQLNKVIIDSNLGGFDIYISEDYNKLYDAESRVWSSGGDQLLVNGELDPATDLYPDEYLIDVSGKKGRYFALVVTRASACGNECWDAIGIREIQVYGYEGNTDFGDNLISKKTPIFNYRAEYGNYGVSLGEVAVQQDGAVAYTDGEKAVISAVQQFPNAGGYIHYNYGVGVMIYYLGGECDVKALSMYSMYHYGPGGIDLYVSETFDTLFNKENKVFTTFGEAATDGMYDTTKNIGALSLSAELKEAKRGRYAAFVITRINDTGCMGSGILRIAELEVWGDLLKKESLPSTTITDKETGSIATFNYDNPDDKFVFVNKGITSFRMAEVDDSTYKSNTFINSLLQNKFKMVGKAFKLEFLDKNNNVVPYSDLDGENISFEFVLPGKDFLRIGEIRNESIYVIKEAEQHGNKLVLAMDKFDYLLSFLTFDEDARGYNGIVVDNGTPDNSGMVNHIVSDDTYVDDNNYTNFENDDSFEESSENNQKQTDGNSKKKSNKKWIAEDVDDPLEWFWNIYDTFADNIWMLIVCIAIAVLCVGSIVMQIVIYKKRRK